MDRAIDALEQSVHLYPSSASTRIELAHALESRGDLGAAVRHLAVGLSLDPTRADTAPLRARLAVLRAAIGQPDDPVPVTHPWQRPDRPLSAALLPHGARLDPATWQP